jgi:hypothetical protein
MTKRRILIQATALAAAVLLVGSLSAKATIKLQLTDAASRSLVGFTSTGVATLNGNEYIGLYKFDASQSTGGEGPSSPFWSTCLSPDGSLNWGLHTYTATTFTAGAPGQNPQSWAAGTQGDAGIQNAQYLWRLLSPTIIASGTQAQGAGLALAMLEALYDSTAYGALGGNNFTVVTWVGGTTVAGPINTAYEWYLYDLSQLSFGAVNANVGNGYVLRSTESGAGQDLIWNVTPVPEPTTMIAGALLLLPFGASTLRFVRRNRTA